MIRACTKVAILPTESIASSSSPEADLAAQCASCAALLGADQRYCLECGERRLPISAFLLGGLASAGEAGASPSSPPPSTPAIPPGAGEGQRSSTLTVIAGVGVLLLAMGVGVLIGRSGAVKQSAAPAQVISVGSTPAASVGATASESFSDGWPSGTSGYTVQLQTLPQAGTLVSAVQAAKRAASAKGAKGVGALKSEDFSSLPAGNYVIYAGVDHNKAEAEKALAGLRKSFPGATVVRVASRGASSSSQGAQSPGGSSSSGAGSSLSHPASPSVLEGLKNSKGKSYEEKSKNLPDVVETG